MTEEKTVTTEEVKSVAPKKAPTKTDSKPSDNNRSGGNRPPQRGRRNQRKKREPKEFEEAVIQIDRVTRVTKGGRQLRFRVSMVIGDQKGRVGFGTGKSSEVMLGIQKGIAKAKRNLINVPIIEDTIPHAVNYKFKATRVLLFPAPEGKGVIAGSSVRKVLELSGVKNVLSKMHGSRNRLNAAYATIEALKMLKNKAPHKSAKKIAEEVEKKSELDKVEVKKTEVKKATPKTKKTVVKKVTSKSTKNKSVDKDDLTKIEGIGPKIAEHLNNEGITTFAALAKTKTEKIQEVLDNAGPRYTIHNPKTWAEQSQMAADGKWAELKKWQDELDGGK